MKRIKKQSKIKQIVCIILIIMLCNFIIPNISYAETDSGTIFAPISKFTVFLCDTLMQFMQDTFITKDKIKQGNSYNFQYSPAIIFSGTVPALDINFMNPDSTVSTGSSAETYIKNSVQEYYGHRNKNYKSQYESAKNNGNTSFIKGGMTKQGVSFSYSVYYWIENDTLNIACMFDSGWKLIRRTI